ncbi:glucan 13-beta-glucosidase, partial [Trifolium medium]|nr:glucan 13-beta-glucosidase [Trifolium medium]
VLIQDIEELLSHNNVSLCHTLGDGNQCADFFTKLGAYDADISIHVSPPEEILDILRSDTIETLFLRE